LFEKENKNNNTVTIPTNKSIATNTTMVTSTEPLSLLPTPTPLNTTSTASKVPLLSSLFDVESSLGSVLGGEQGSVNSPMISRQTSSSTLQFTSSTSTDSFLLKCLNGTGLGLASESINNPSVSNAPSSSSSNHLLSSTLSDSLFGLNFSSSTGGSSLAEKQSNTLSSLLNFNFLPLKNDEENEDNSNMDIANTTCFGLGFHNNNNNNNEGNTTSIFADRTERTDLLLKSLSFYRNNDEEEEEEEEEEEARDVTNNTINTGADATTTVSLLAHSLAKNSIKDTPAETTTKTSTTTASSFGLANFGFGTTSFLLTPSFDSNEGDAQGKVNVELEEEKTQGNISALLSKHVAQEEEEEEESKSGSLERQLPQEEDDNDDEQAMMEDKTDAIFAKLSKIRRRSSLTSQLQLQQQQNHPLALLTRSPSRSGFLPSMTSSMPSSPTSASLASTYQHHYHSDQDDSSSQLRYYILLFLFSSLFSLLSSLFSLLSSSSSSSSSSFCVTSLLFSYSFLCFNSENSEGLLEKSITLTNTVLNTLSTIPNEEEDADADENDDQTMVDATTFVNRHTAEEEEEGEGEDEKTDTSTVLCDQFGGDKTDTIFFKTSKFKHNNDDDNNDDEDGNKSEQLNSTPQGIKMMETIPSFEFSDNNNAAAHAEALQLNKDVTMTSNSVILDQDNTTTSNSIGINLAMLSTPSATTSSALRLLTNTPTHSSVGKRRRSATMSPRTPTSASSKTRRASGTPSSSEVRSLLLHSPGLARTPQAKLPTMGSLSTLLPNVAVSESITALASTLLPSPASHSARTPQREAPITPQQPTQQHLATAESTMPIESFLSMVKVRFLDDVAMKRRRSSIGGLLAARAAAISDAAEVSNEFCANQQPSQEAETSIESKRQALKDALVLKPELEALEKGCEHFTQLTESLREKTNQQAAAFSAENPPVFAVARSVSALPSVMKSVKSFCRRQAKLEWQKWQLEGIYTPLKAALARNLSLLSQDRTLVMKHTAEVAVLVEAQKKNASQLPQGDTSNNRLQILKQRADEVHLTENAVKDSIGNTIHFLFESLILTSTTTPTDDLEILQKLHEWRYKTETDSNTGITTIQLTFHSHFKIVLSVQAATKSVVAYNFSSSFTNANSDFVEVFFSLPPFCFC